MSVLTPRTEWRPFLCRLGFHRWKRRTPSRYDCDRCWRERHVKERS